MTPLSRKCAGGCITHAEKPATFEALSLKWALPCKYAGIEWRSECETCMHVRGWSCAASYATIEKKTGGLEARVFCSISIAACGTWVREREIIIHPTPTESVWDCVRAAMRRSVCVRRGVVNEASLLGKFYIILFEFIHKRLSISSTVFITEQQRNK
jgi:hypothetical protein